MNIISRIFVGLLVVSALSACSKQTESGMIVAGSTSVQPYAEILAEEFMIIHPELAVDVQGGGSSAGITAARTDSAEIGMSSRGLKKEEQDLYVVEIAKDGLALVVHPENNLKNLSVEQIRDIYSGTITHWSDLGGNHSKIHVITREEGSGTRSAFAELLMGDVEISTKAIVQDSNGAVLQLVADDPNAIGYISLGLVSDQVKALHLNNIEPSRDNIMNHSYLLSRPFLFVMDGEPAGVAKTFIEFTLSEEGQHLLSKEGLIPVARTGQ